MPIKTDELEIAMNEYLDYLREREEYPVDPTWLEDVGRDHLVEQFDVEGVDESGAENWFLPYKEKWRRYKASHGKSMKKMEEDGDLRRAVDNSDFEVFKEGGTTVYRWEWSQRGENGGDYAAYWQNEFEGDDEDPRDRKLRFDKKWLSGIAEEWARMEAERIEEIFS